MRIKKPPENIIVIDLDKKISLTSGRLFAKSYNIHSLIQMRKEYENYEDYIKSCKTSECVEKLIEQNNYLGVGNFSEAYRLGKTLVIKKNSYASAINDMKNEILAYNLLKDNFQDIFPYFMKGFEFKAETIYYIVREYGVDINSNKISSEAYNKFIERLYQLAEYGIFWDLIQIGIRESGDIFLIDLGEFIPKDKILESEMPCKYQNIQLCIYEELEKLIILLDKKVGLSHKIPKKIRKLVSKLK